MLIDNFPLMIDKFVFLQKPNVRNVSLTNRAFHFLFEGSHWKLKDIQIIVLISISSGANQPMEAPC